MSDETLPQSFPSSRRSDVMERPVFKKKGKRLVAKFVTLSETPVAEEETVNKQQENENEDEDLSSSSSVSPSPLASSAESEHEHVVSEEAKEGESTPLSAESPYKTTWAVTKSLPSSPSISPSASSSSLTNLDDPSQARQQPNSLKTSNSASSIPSVSSIPKISVLSSPFSIPSIPSIPYVSQTHSSSLPPVPQSPSSSSAPNSGSPSPIPVPGPKTSHAPAPAPASSFTAAVPSQQATIRSQVDEQQKEITRLHRLVSQLQTKCEHLERQYADTQTALVSVLDSVSRMDPHFKRPSSFSPYSPLSSAPTTTSLSSSSSSSSTVSTQHSQIVSSSPSDSDESYTLEGVEKDKTVICQGYLLKKGRKVRNWKRRWFVLHANKLSYYKSASDKTSIDDINLETSVIDDLKEREESGRACMAVLVEGRKLLFTAETMEENRNWYLRLLCKNSELTYLRKVQITNAQPNISLINFLRNPLVTDLRFDASSCPLPAGFGIEDTVALTSPLRNHEHIAHLSLDFVALANLSVQSICIALKSSTSIKTLSLQGNGLTAECAFDLTELLVANRSLEKLLLNNNDFSDRGVEIVCNGLARSVRPPSTSFSSVKTKVAIVNARTLKLISLDNNGLTPLSAKNLMNAFQKVEWMPDFSLHNNNLGDEGLCHFLGLLHRPGYSRLLLDNNKITEIGCLALASALSTDRPVKLSEILLQDNSFPPTAQHALSLAVIRCKSVKKADFVDNHLGEAELNAIRVLFANGLLSHPL